MAREDFTVDEGNAFGRRRGNVPVTPATPEEVQAAIDAASTELDVDRNIPNEAAANLFAPIGGGPVPGDASVADQAMFAAEGYNVGPLPAQYQKMFGADQSVIGWKIQTNPDGSQQIVVARPQGDADGGLQFQTYGAKIKTDASGNVVPFIGANAGGANGTTTTGTTTGFGPGSAGYEDRKSAYDILFQEFSRYGLGSMVEPLKALITEGVSPSEFGLRLTQTDAYKKRFAANQDRINKGLRALTPAEYIGLEDQYQSIMRNYGLPASYYTKGDLGTQEGFNKLLGADVSAAELEDRIATAQKRVLNTNPEVLQALKKFYPDLNNADILAYTLDPDKALSEIQRKVTAAEIGGAALAQGLQAQGGTAEALAGYGITKAQAQQGYQTIGEFLPTAQKLGDIYQNQGLGAYDQATAEKEVFGTAGAATAAQKRKKLAQLEQATFSGQAGTSQGALERGRQGAF